jgi:predicted SAM-dependent methyltransferase/cephalosporin hydroxylase
MLSKADGLAIAAAAREKNDFGTVLLTLARLTTVDKSDTAVLALRGLALLSVGRLEEADAVLRELVKQQPGSAQEELLREVKRRRKIRDRRWDKVKIGGSPLRLDPADALALTQVVYAVKPKIVLELGSLGGGAAVWLANLIAGLGIDARIHSADWEAPAKTDHGRITFYSGDLRNPAGVFPAPLLKGLPHPCLVLLRTLGGHDVTRPALTSLHQWLKEGDTICVIDEADHAGTSAQALARFAAMHPVEYGTLTSFETVFGPEGAPTNVRCLQHTGLDREAESAAPGLDSVRQKMTRGEWHAALADLDAIKTAGQSRQGVDYLRSICFVELGEWLKAREAARAELQLSPNHSQAQAIFEAMHRQLFPGPPAPGGNEFHQIAREVRRHSLLSDASLYSIYLRVRLICQMDVPGDIVECSGTAGGAAALMAAVVAKHSRQPRKVYACHTSTPNSSWRELTGALGVGHLVQPAALSSLKDVLGNGIGFLHIEGRSHEAMMDILDRLYPSVQMSGFIQIDHYGDSEGCREAMLTYASRLGFEFEVHPIDATGVWLQRPDRKALDLMKLNLGCGVHFHSDWINLDIAPSAAEVIAHNLAEEPLPFENRCCAAVYHSHVLEHIPLPSVRPFIDECFRVLAPGGVLRIVVPDLETIARLYLENLSAAAQGDENAANQHEWMTIELVDQLTRETPGGQMLEYWKQNPMPAEAFVFERSGWEARRFVDQWRADPSAVNIPTAKTAAEIGKFRLGGEVHKWMWDRISLTRLLTSAGFEDVQVCLATESSIPGFPSYLLDADAEGHTRKPDSLFIEAKRPAH